MMFIRFKDAVTGRPLPPSPTSAEPGSLRKIAVMRKRWRLGYALHHPLDLTLDEYSDPVETLVQLLRSSDRSRTGAKTNGSHHKNGRLR